MQLSHYYFEYDYDTYYACHHGSSCCDNDYCRCGVINNTQITKVDLDYLLRATFEEIDKKKKTWTDIDRYCVGRLLIAHNMHDGSNYELTVCGGYYGEEISGIYSNSIYAYMNDVREMFALSDDNARIKFVVQKEYGYLLDDMHDAVFELKTVKYSDILAPLDLRRVEGESHSFDTAIAICRHIGDDKYRIVDGHHRWKNAEGQKKVKILLY